MMKADFLSRPFLLSLHHVAVNIQCQSRSLLPGELSRMLLSIRAKLLSLMRTFKQVDNCFRKNFHVQRIDQTRLASKGFLQRWYAPGNHGRTTRHCFERWQTKTFIDGRVDE